MCGSSAKLMPSIASDAAATERGAEIASANNTGPNLASQRI